MGKKRNLKYKEYFKTIQKNFKVALFDKGESLFLLFPERALSKYVVMNTIVDKEFGFMAGRYNDKEGSHTLISYPTSTDSKTIRRMVSKIDRKFKMFAYNAYVNDDFEIAGFKKIEKPFGIDTNIKTFVKLRNQWIRTRAKDLKKIGKKGGLLYIIIQKELEKTRPFFNLWRPRKRSANEVELKKHYILETSTIKNVVTRKK